MRRHWITTALAGLCFATAAAELYSLSLFLGHGSTANAPLYAAIWRFLGLFPTAAAISWPVNLIVGVVSPAFISSKVYSGIFSVLTFVVSGVIGIAILRMRSWARTALMTICALTIADQLFTLFQFVHYSSGFLTVLQSDYRGPISGYVAGIGTGSFLAGLAIAIALLRFLLQNGLPTTAPESPDLPVGGDISRAHKLVLYGTAGVIAVEVVFLLATFHQSGLEVNRIRLLLCLLLPPHALILARSWRAPDRLSLGLAAGYGVLVAYIGALFLPAFLLGLVLIAGSRQSGELLPYLLLEVVPLLQCAVAIGAIITTRSLPPVPMKSPKLGVWGLAFLIPVVAGTALPQFYSDWQRGTLPLPGAKSSGDEYHELMRHDAAARELVRKYGYCAFLYANSHTEEGFPENAEKMGPTGSTCLTREEAAGNLEGYSFRYAVQRSDGSTRFDHFIAAAQLNNQHQFAATLVDEKGIVVFGSSRELQPHMVTADQVSWDAPGLLKAPMGRSVPWILPKIVACATVLRDQSGTGEFPATLAEVLRVKIKPTDRDCLPAYELGDQLLRAAGNSNRAAHTGDVVEYQPQQDSSGKVAHFSLTLRPEHYGVDGIRSYFTDDSGAIHATSQNRSASVEDPASLSCETESAPLCEEPKAP